MLYNIIYILKQHNINAQLNDEDGESYIFFPDITMEGFYMYCYIKNNQIKCHKRIGSEGYDYNLGDINENKDKKINFLINQYNDMKNILT